MPLMLLLAACAGTAARQQVLLPAIAGAWSDVRLQVVRELLQVPNTEATAAVAAADRAIASGDAVQVATVPWPLIEQTALADVDRRLAADQIGPLVAESLRGRITDLRESIALYIRRIP
ncbi:MAG: hypothetical protein JNK15_23735 [Planctomycetes bacterium]|nr:hypothetical protein [Planctomycetota bacterium]